MDLAPITSDWSWILHRLDSSNWSRVGRWIHLPPLLLPLFYEFPALRCSSSRSSIFAESRILGFHGEELAMEVICGTKMLILAVWDFIFASNLHLRCCFSSRLFDAFRSARDFVPFIYLFKHMCLIYLLMDTTNATTKSEENAKIYFYNIIFCPWVCYQLGDQFICVCTPSYYQFNGLKKASTY